MDDASLFHPELDRAALGVFDRLSDVGCHRADPGVGHEAAGAQHLPEATYEGHHVRRGDHPVEFHEPALDALHQILGAHDVGPRRRGFGGLGVLGDDRDPDLTPGAGRQGHDAAHLLIGVTGIDAEIDGDLHALVELGGGVGLDQLDRILEPVDRLAIAGPGFFSLGFPGHLRPPQP